MDIVAFSSDGSGEILAEDGVRRNTAITYTFHNGNQLTIELAPSQ